MSLRQTTASIMALSLNPPKPPWTQLLKKSDLTKSMFEG